MDRLGTVVGEMHAVLASDASDPVFAPEEASAESLALLTATVDDEIAAVFAGLPEDEVVAPIAGHGDDVRDLLRGLSTVGSVGKRIRHHGDLHLGQTLWDGGDWLIIDFEGEPARGAARAAAEGLAAPRRRRDPALLHLCGLRRRHGRRGVRAPCP